jgi:hypothetical protein
MASSDVMPSAAAAEQRTVTRLSNIVRGLAHIEAEAKQASEAEQRVARAVAQLLPEYKGNNSCPDSTSQTQCDDHDAKRSSNGTVVEAPSLIAALRDEVKRYEAVERHKAIAQSKVPCMTSVSRHKADIVAEKRLHAMYAAQAQAVPTTRTVDDLIHACQTAAGKRRHTLTRTASMDAVLKLHEEGDFVGSLVCELKRTHDHHRRKQHFKLTRSPSNLKNSANARRSANDPSLLDIDSRVRFAVPASDAKNSFVFDHEYDSKGMPHSPIATPLVSSSPPPRMHAAAPSQRNAQYNSSVHLQSTDSNPSVAARFLAFAIRLTFTAMLVSILYVLARKSELGAPSSSADSPTPLGHGQLKVPGSGSGATGMWDKWADSIESIIVDPLIQWYQE